MLYFIIILICIILIGWIIYYNYSKNKLLANIERGINLIKFGLAVRLIKNLRKRYDEDFAIALSSAMTNEIFSEKPGNEDAVKFLNTNKSIVESELRLIGYDEKICHVISQAIRARSATSFSNNIKRWGQVEKLESYGILNLKGKFPTLEEFVQLANEFYSTREDD